MSSTSPGQAFLDTPMQLRHLTNRFASTPTKEILAPAASISEISRQSDQASPDARVVTESIGDLVYEWNLTTDKLRWGNNVNAVLGPVAKGDLSTGLGYGERLSAESVMSRYEAIFNSDSVDVGSRRSLSGHRIA